MKVKGDVREEKEPRRLGNGLVVTWQSSPHELVFGVELDPSAISLHLISLFYSFEIFHRIPTPVTIHWINTPKS